MYLDILYLKEKRGLFINEKPLVVNYSYFICLYIQVDQRDHFISNQPSFTWPWLRLYIWTIITSYFSFSLKCSIKACWGIKQIPGTGRNPGVWPLGDGLRWQLWHKGSQRYLPPARIPEVFLYIKYKMGVLLSLTNTFVKNTSIQF